MILSVGFNTKEKAERCLKSLGVRGIGLWTFMYKGKQLGGFTVHYWSYN